MQIVNYQNYTKRLDCSVDGVNYMKTSVKSNWLIRTHAGSLCSRAHGMQNGLIKNNSIKASSELNSKSAAYLGRLRHMQHWCAKYNNHNQWLQMDLKRSSKVTGIAIQGGEIVHWWVTRFLVLSSVDGIAFAVYKEWSSDKVSIFRKF